MLWCCVFRLVGPLDAGPVRCRLNGTAIEALAAQAATRWGLKNAARGCHLVESNRIDGVNTVRLNSGPAVLTPCPHTDRSYHSHRYNTASSAMVRKRSRKDTKAKKKSSSSTPSLNDRGRYQPQHRKPITTGSSSKPALKSKKAVDTSRCV